MALACIVFASILQFFTFLTKLGHFDALSRRKLAPYRQRAIACSHTAIRTHARTLDGYSLDSA
jgi:hypothetical protein